MTDYARLTDEQAQAFLLRAVRMLDAAAEGGGSISGDTAADLLTDIQQALDLDEMQDVLPELEKAAKAG